MTADRRCEAVQAVAPELALGIADGRERADALAHLASCAACRAYVAELTDVADDLLALTPAEEPPVGFEGRVLARVGIAPAHPRLGLERVQRLVPAAVVLGLAAVAVTAVSLLVASRDDRELADQYRSALENVGGEYFQAARLRDGRQRPVGQVFGYQGRPSWLFVVLYRPYRDEPITGTLTTTDGRSVSLGELELDGRQGSWGDAIPLDLRDVIRVELVDRDGDVYQARIPAGP